MRNLLLLSLTIIHTICFPQTIVMEHYKISSTSGNFTSIIDNGDQFGTAVDCIGDLNNDGVDDFVITAQRDDDGGNDKGAVYILFMNEDGSVNSEQKISDTEGNFLGNLNEIDVFGSSVASMGDLNGDGINDIAVGAEYDSDGGYWSGAVWILFLNTDGTVSAFNKINEEDLNLDIFGTPTFGSSMANIGDINGDGINDIAVGSRRDDDGGTRKGAVWILFLNQNGEVFDYQKISDTQGNFGYNLDYEDAFGRSVANLGDLNGDGINDIAVGAHRDDDGSLNSGAIYILFLNADGTVSESQKISSTQGYLNTYLATDCFFGVSISTTGDLNGDCITDIVVGAPKQESSNGITGAAYILYLNSNGTVNYHQEITIGEMNFDAEIDNDDFFGRSIAFIGGEGDIKSILVGASKDDDGIIDGGAAWILKLKGAVETPCDELYDESGDCYNDSDSDGICDELEIVGCSDENACNFNPNSTDEGECTFIDMILEYDIEDLSIVTNSSYPNIDSYEWSINGSIINSNDSSITINQNGLYELTAYDLTNDCSTSASIIISDMNIESTLNTEKYIYPNPSNGIINFQNFNKNEILGVYNLTGELIHSFKVQGAVDISHLHTGIYFIKNNKNTFKLVVQ
jgi:hypothetical protein